MENTQATENSRESGIFGLRYLEEEEADILDVAGCQSVSAEEEAGASITYRFCGDWDTDRSEEIS